MATSLSFALRCGASSLGSRKWLCGRGRENKGLLTGRSRAGQDRGACVLTRAQRRPDGQDSEPHLHGGNEGTCRRAGRMERIWLQATLESSVALFSDKALAFETVDHYELPHVAAQQVSEAVGGAVGAGKGALEDLGDVLQAAGSAVGQQFEAVVSQVEDIPTSVAESVPSDVPNPMDLVDDLTGSVSAKLTGVLAAGKEMVGAGKELVGDLGGAVKEQLGAVTSQGASTLVATPTAPPLPAFDATSAINAAVAFASQSPVAAGVIVLALVLFPALLLARRPASQGPAASKGKAYAGDLTPADALELLAGDGAPARGGPVLVDVRSAPQIKKDGLPMLKTQSGEVVLPNWVPYEKDGEGEFVEKLGAKVAAGSSVVVLDRSGDKAPTVSRLLTQKGYPACAVKGGAVAWKESKLPWAVPPAAAAVGVATVTPTISSPPAEEPSQAASAIAPAAPAAEGRAPVEVSAPEAGHGVGGTLAEEEVIAAEGADKLQEEEEAAAAPLVDTVVSTVEGVAEGGSAKGRGAVAEEEEEEEEKHQQEGGETGGAVAESEGVKEVGEVVDEQEVEVGDEKEEREAEVLSVEAAAGEEEEEEVAALEEEEAALGALDSDTGEAVGQGEEEAIPGELASFFGALGAEAGKAEEGAGVEVVAAVEPSEVEGASVEAVAAVEPSEVAGVVEEEVKPEPEWGDGLGLKQRREVAVAAVSEALEPGTETLEETRGAEVGAGLEVSRAGDGVEKIVVLYESGWEKAYLHYTVDGTRWTELPGVPMEVGPSSTSKILTIDNASKLEFVLTDGAGDWDVPPAGGNYHIDNSGVFKLSFGTITDATPVAA